MQRILSSVLAFNLCFAPLTGVLITQTSWAQGQDSQAQELRQLMEKGVQQARQGQSEQAIETLKKALSFSRQIKIQVAEGIALLWLGISYATLNQLEPALDYYNQALPIFKTTKERLLEADTLNNIGRIYSRLAKPQQAIEFFNQALPTFKAAGDRKMEATILNDIGSAYSVLGQRPKALEFFNQALPIFKAVSDRTMEATTLNNIGIVYSLLGEPQKSLEFYNQSLAIERELGNKKGVAATLVNIGAVYREIGQPKKALELYNQVLPIFKETGNISAEATVLNNIGRVYAAMRQPQKALEFYNLSLLLLRQVGDRSREAATLNNIGTIYYTLNQSKKALEFYNQALPIWKEIGDRASLASGLNNIGMFYYTNNQRQKALEFYNLSLPILREVGDRAREADTLNNVAEVYRELNRPNEAITNFEQAVEITIKIRASLKRENRQQFLQDTQRRAINLVDILINQKKPERAYEWVNLSNTVDLVDYSRLINAKVANPEAQKQIEQWNLKNQQLETLRQELQTKFSENLALEINELQAEINQQAETISRDFPEVAELFETTPRDIIQLRANIPAETVIIHPVLLTEATEVPKSIAIFVITKSKLSVIKQPINPKEFDTLVTQYRRQVTSQISNAYKASSEKLYDILIRPVEAQIQAASPNQLSIITTGKLRYIPFETLYDRQTKQFLIQKYPINNITRISSRSLRSIETSNKLPLNGLLALGNPFPQDQRNLSGAEKEVASIKQLLPNSQVYINDRATLNIFKTYASRFSVLHIATHGCFKSGGCPDLKMPANTLLFADRNLNIADAALLGLKNIDLLTLSACQTAVQANSNGEEIAGIAYLFERAGAKAVIASLWSVDDTSTKDLMIKFYENLKQGMSKGEALRQAKISQIKLHPYFWSPFILIGDAR